MTLRIGGIALPDEIEPAASSEQSSERRPDAAEPLGSELVQEADEGVGEHAGRYGDAARAGKKATMRSKGPGVPLSQ